MFATEMDPITGQAIHDELVVLLIEYLTQHKKTKEKLKFLNVRTCACTCTWLSSVLIFAVVFSLCRSSSISS